jgi:hypothetical protein
MARRAPPAARATTATTMAATRRNTLLLFGAGAAGTAVSIGALVALRGQSQPSAAAPVDADTIVVDRPEIDLGRVPLNVTVPVSVRLTNQSLRTVTLGRPTAVALEGC